MTIMNIDHIQLAMPIGEELREVSKPPVLPS